MTEPSVLDYLKSILDPRKKAIRLSDLEEKPDSQMVEELFPTEDTPAESKKFIPKDHIPFRWRISAAIICLLIGQFFMDQPTQKLGLGLIFYGVGAGFLILSIILKDWQFSEISKTSPRKNLADWHINWIAFAAGTISMIVSFIFLSGNLFNTFNLVFWLIAIVCYMQAFSEENVLSQSINWLMGLFTKKFDFSKPLKIQWWTILIVFVTAIIVFFRFYQLNEIPGEMFSDHAEKLADVSDILNGQYGVYFPRNTGREAFQMYLTAFIATTFGTGLSFLSLKLGTALAGLFTLPFIYLLGKELANKHVGLIAYFLAGIAYWPNVISRVGLRFPLYPLFAAPVLFFLIRGLRQSRKWDFVWAGLFLGVGLHGYSPARMIPIVVVIGVLIYFLHMKTKAEKIGSVYALIVIAIISFVVFMPLLHYALWNMDMFSYRAMTRLGTVEAAYPGNPLFIFFGNLFKSLVMFFWKNGDIWVHSVPNRPALGIISAIFYFVGSVYVSIRYIKKRDWVDLFLLLSVPLLMMPSIMSLAFPGENPSLNRSGGAIIPVFILAAIGLEGLLRTVANNARQVDRRPYMAVLIGVFFFGFAMMQNYSLIFDSYKTRFLRGAWNSSDMGAVIDEFASTYGDYEHAYIVPFDYWVDTTLVGITSQKQVVNIALWPDQFESTLEYKGAKLFILKYDDYTSLDTLQTLYPTSVFWRHVDQYEGKDFFVLFVAPTEQNFEIQEPTD
ncbi:MAG: glycosyltransferase family 39 protein [Anaerolineaceae bacterium]|nr:glycosyltransferase family 39 protein [Anaerolineaceae bacterium]